MLNKVGIALKTLCYKCLIADIYYNMFPSSLDRDETPHVKVAMFTFFFYTLKQCLLYFCHQQRSGRH